MSHFMVSVCVGLADSFENNPIERRYRGPVLLGTIAEFRSSTDSLRIIVFHGAEGSQAVSFVLL